MTRTFRVALALAASVKMALSARASNLANLR
jgi:hypothetical protein